MTARCIASSADHHSGHRRLWRAYASCTSAHTCTGTAAVWRCAPGCRWRTWNSSNSTHRHLRLGLPRHRRRARRRRLSRQCRGRAFHGALRAIGERLASRDVVSRAMTIESAKAARRQEKGSHLSAPRPSRSKVLHERLPGISESVRIFAGVDVTASRSRSCRRCITIWAASHQLSRRSRDQEERRRQLVVPGLMAIGEAACVSVHGANRSAPIR